MRGFINIENVENNVEKKLKNVKNSKCGKCGKCVNVENYVENVENRPRIYPRAVLSKLKCLFGNYKANCAAAYCRRKRYNAAAYGIIYAID